MLNRPQNAYTDPARDDASSWDVDAHPSGRLVWLWTLMVLPLVVILGRLAWIQATLTDEYIAAFDVTTESFETIPKRDGRILSADGRILAEDLQQFDIEVSYRWAESPANPAWLKQQALVRLDRKDRRKKDRLEAAQRDVLARQEAMWRRLAKLTGIEEDQLHGQRLALQQRIERMSGRIEWNRREQQFASRASEERPVELAADSWWDRGWRGVLSELTTAPHRETADAIVVQEELKHHPLLQNVPFEVAARIQSHPEDFPGLRIQTSSTRIYPQKSLAPHIVGSRLAMSDDELTTRREKVGAAAEELQPGDRIGRNGVERSYDSLLRGQRGRRRLVRNRRGEIVLDEVVREPRIGSDVVLTLHLDLQERLEKLLDRAISTAPEAVKPPAGGCIVAIDIHTGAVLAAASAPRFDLDLLVHPDAERWNALAKDARRPFFDRATQMALPPGSVFKALSAVAFLESGQIHPEDTVPCAGFLDSPNRYRCYVYTHFGVGHGDTNLSDALAQSCNVYFFANARKIGPAPLVAWAERFGFGQPTGIDLPGEQAGNLPRPPDKEAKPAAGDASKPKPWHAGDTLGLAIGQSRLLATPMQIARMMATVANGGWLVTPHVVRDQTLADPDFDATTIDGSRSGGLNPHYETKSSFAPRRIPGLHEETLAEVRVGLEKVVNDRRGTGHKSVAMKEVAIAGKTGTAEVGGGKSDHAWFAGYVPADRPRIAFVVVLEHAGSGGRAAGPVAKELVQTLLALGILQSSQMTNVGD